MPYGRGTYGYRGRRSNVYRRRRRAAARVTKSLQTVGLVDKKVVPIVKYQDNILGVQSKFDYHLTPAAEWFDGADGTTTAFSAGTSPLTFEQHYDRQQWFCSVPKGLDSRFGQHVADNNNDSTYLTYHSKAARAYVLNFGSKSSQHLMGFDDMQEGQPTTNSIYNLENKTQGQASKRVKERYFEDYLNFWKLKQGKKAHINSTEHLATLEEGIGDYKDDQFSGEKIYAKSARVRMRLQYADWPLADMNRKLEVITKGYHHNEDGVALMEENPIESGTTKDSKALENATDFMKTSYFQWLAQGAKMRVRYMRLLQLEHKDERYDPDVAHDLFRDWDGEKTFGLLGGAESPSYHRYMEAQVNKKYYKIIRHKFLTLRPARNFIPIWTPTLRPTVMSWNTVNYAKVASNSGLTHVTTGAAATNQVNRVGPVSNPNNLTNVINVTENTHSNNFQTDSMVLREEQSHNNNTATQANVDGTPLKRKREPGDAETTDFVEIDDNEDAVQNTVGQSMQMVQVGKGDGTENFNFHFKFNKAIQMFHDESTSVAGESLVWEPYSKKSKNHKIVMVFEPVGVDPKFNLIMQYFMPRVKMNIEGHAVYSSVN